MSLTERIRDSRGVPNDPVDGQVDQERHHTREQHCHLENKGTKLLSHTYYTSDTALRTRVVCVSMGLTRAGRDQGPNIPPSPVRGSKKGTMQSRKPDDRGA